VVRWRRIGLRERIKARFGVMFHEHSIGKMLRRLNFRRISVRPEHPESDEAEREAFKKFRRTGTCRHPNQRVIQADRVLVAG
jgi:transposase